MFLSRDMFDDVPEVQRERQVIGAGVASSSSFSAPPPSHAAVPHSTFAPSSPSGTFGRHTPSSLNGRSYASDSTGLFNVPEAPGGRDTDDEAVPSSAATLRQKMLQQRQRTLQKRNSTPLLSTSSMVLSNEVPPVSEVNLTPNGRSLSMNLGRPGTGTGASSSSMPATPSRGLGSMGMLSRASTSASSSGGLGLDQQHFGSMPFGDQDGFLVVAPELCLDDEEAEATRRRELAQELDEKGISPEYDPTLDGPGGNTMLGRASLMEISGVPALMRNFILNPAPKASGMIECRIIRDRNGLNKLYPRYTLESDAGIFMLTAKKQPHNTTSNYSITLSRNEKDSKDADSYLGKLRSNFLGLEFVGYGTGLNPKKIDSSMSQVHAMQLTRQEMCAITYTSSIWGGAKPRGPRKMSAVIPKVQPNGERTVCRTLKPEAEGLLALQKAGGANHLIDCYQNKPPKWNEQVGAFVLNFNKRVTQASVKNFQLTSCDDPDTVYLQFGRVGKDTFNMDFRYPFSPFQAFCICLSSFDYKLCCE